MHSNAPYVQVELAVTVQLVRYRAELAVAIALDLAFAQVVLPEPHLQTA